jgi:hypothetical protein
LLVLPVLVDIFGKNAKPTTSAPAARTARAPVAEA